MASSVSSTPPAAPAMPLSVASLAPPQATPAPLQVLVDDRRVAFPTRRVTAGEIKAAAGVRPDCHLYLRRPGGNEPFRDAEALWLEPETRFFTRPPSSISCLDDHR